MVSPLMLVSMEERDILMHRVAGKLVAMRQARIQKAAADPGGYADTGTGGAVVAPSGAETASPRRRTACAVGRTDSEPEIAASAAGAVGRRG
jgi:hypothetical protein